MRRAVRGALECLFGFCLCFTAACVQAEILVWGEDFEGPELEGCGLWFSDGALVETMSAVTRWALSVSDGGLASEGSYAWVTNGCLEVRDTDEEVVWRSDAILTGGGGALRMEADVRAVGQLEQSDWVELRVVADGRELPSVQAVGGFGSTTLVVMVESAEWVTLSVGLRNSAADERFRLEAVRVAAAFPVAPQVLVEPNRHVICVAEGLEVSFDVSAWGPPGERLALSAMGLPAGGCFVPTQDVERVGTTFSWVASREGRHRVVFVAQGAREHVEWPLDICVHDGGHIWINELHYDNEGIDVGEGVELAGAPQLVLDGYVLDACNGADGGIVEAQRCPLSGSLGYAAKGVGVLWCAMENLQNGPDAVALWGGGGCLASCVWDVVGYEGRFVIREGPAAGVVACPVGVTEGASTAAGMSLQRTGSGWGRNGFQWTGPRPATCGVLNADQDPRSPRTVFIVR